jgi:hypothetical protein
MIFFCRKWILRNGHFLKNKSVLRAYGKMNFRSNCVRLNNDSIKWNFGQMAFGQTVFGQMMFRSNRLSVKWCLVERRSVKWCFGQKAFGQKISVKWSRTLFNTNFEFWITPIVCNVRKIFTRPTSASDIFHWFDYHVKSFQHCLVKSVRDLVKLLLVTILDISVILIWKPFSVSMYTKWLILSSINKNSMNEHQTPISILKVQS